MGEWQEKKAGEDADMDSMVDNGSSAAGGELDVENVTPSSPDNTTAKSPDEEKGNFL
ncbi:MAG: hypothetical protein INR71_10870, partial [Terriglobus roseus]|nr:hypothetical protein [Terriglobus roseus]